MIDSINNWKRLNDIFTKCIFVAGKKWKWTIQSNRIFHLNNSIQTCSKLYVNTENMVSHNSNLKSCRNIFNLSSAINLTTQLISPIFFGIIICWKHILKILMTNKWRKPTICAVINAYCECCECIKSVSHMLPKQTWNWVIVSAYFLFTNFKGSFFRLIRKVCRELSTSRSWTEIKKKTDLNFKLWLIFFRKYTEWPDRWNSYFSNKICKWIWLVSCKLRKKNTSFTFLVVGYWFEKSPTNEWIMCQ